MLRFISKLFILIFVTINLNSISYAQDPKEFIEEVTKKASSILKSNIDKNQKTEKLKELAERSVDIKGVGFYSLGKHRKTISKEKLNEYEMLFKSYFLKSFSSRLSEYSDPKINVISKNVINKNYTIVSSILVADEKRPEIKIDWRVYTKIEERPLIRDLIIEGLSLARTQKEEFSSVINSADGNVEVLFENLRKFIK